MEKIVIILSDLLIVIHVIEVTVMVVNQSLDLVMFASAAVVKDVKICSYAIIVDVISALSAKMKVFATIASYLIVLNVTKHTTVRSATKKFACFATKLVTI